MAGAFFLIIKRVPLPNYTHSCLPLPPVRGLPLFGQDRN